MSQFTLCALFYGDYPELAERCLSSLRPLLPSPRVAEIRLAANAPSPAVTRVLESFVDSAPVRTTLDTASHNRRKYPVMRSLFYGVAPITTDWVMWFDDDSCLRNPQAMPQFFEECAQHLLEADVIGQLWTYPLQRRQRSWIEAQPWYTGNVISPAMRFAQGAWWCARLATLQQFDYPWSALDHNGGDVMLGALCEQQGLRLRRYCTGVAINADVELRDSKSPRRGYTAPPIGSF